MSPTRTKARNTRPCLGLVATRYESFRGVNSATLAPRSLVCERGLKRSIPPGRYVPDGRVGDNLTTRARIARITRGWVRGPGPQGTPAASTPPLRGGVVHTEVGVSSSIKNRK